MNQEEKDILHSIHACKTLEELSQLIVQTKNKELLRSVLAQIKYDFLDNLIIGNSIFSITRFIERLLEIDPKQAKIALVSLDQGILKQIIAKEKDMSYVLQFFNLVIHRLFALAFFKKLLDMDVLRKNYFNFCQFCILYSYFCYITKIDNTFKVSLEFEMLSKALRNVSVNQMVADIHNANIYSKDFLETLLGVIGLEKILSSPKITLESMEKLLDLIYDTDREMFLKAVKANLSIIKAKIHACLAEQMRDAADLIDFMYKSDTKYAEQLIEKGDLKGIIDSELADMHDIADFVMVLIKRSPSFGKEFVPHILRSRVFLHFFNYADYLKVTDVKQKLKILHSTLETLFKENRERKLLNFFSYFARSEMLKIASEGCGKMKLVFPEFLDIQLEEQFDGAFSIGDEALDLNLREMAGSSLETKEDMLLDIQTESEKGGGTEIFFEMLHRESNKIEEKFQKRHAECLLKPNNAEKLVILADLFAIMYTGNYYYADVPYEDLIHELGVMAEKIEIDF